MDNKNLKEEQLTLELLDAIEKDSDISQRHLAKKMGIALGLTNSYLKRCIKKGLIKIHDAPANRYLYYITPQGFAEKSRLTAQYLSNSFSFYRKAGDSCIDVYQMALHQGWDKFILCGASELAEIAALRAAEVNIDIKGIYDPNISPKKYLGKEVFKSIDSLPEHDAYLITSIGSAQEIYNQVVNSTNKERVFAPEILGIDTALNLDAASNVGR